MRQSLEAYFKIFTEGSRHFLEAFFKIFTEGFRHSSKSTAGGPYYIYDGAESAPTPPRSLRLQLWCA